MLFLPPGQGFSIYSLAAVLPLLAAKQRPTDSERLDDDRRRGRLSRPELPDALPHHPHRQAPLQPRARRPRCRCREPERCSASRSRPDYEISRVIRGGWQLAGGHGAVDAAAAVEDMVAFAEAGITTFDCADIYTGVEELIGAFRARYRRARGAEALGADQGAHQVRARPRPPAAADPRRRPQASSTARCKRLGTERLDLVQFHWWDYGVAGLPRGGAVAGRAARATARSAISAAPISTPAHGGDRRRRRAARLDAGAVFAARPPAGEGDARPPPRRAASRCSATAPSPAASSATAGSGGAEPRSRSRTARSPSTS